MNNKKSFDMQQYSDDESMGYVRVFHAVPDAPSVDIYADDTLIISDLAYGDFTEYLPIPEGKYKITLYVAGTKNSPVLSNMLTVMNDTYLTVGAIGTLDTIGLVGIVDDNMPMSQGKAMIRFVHLSPDAPAVDITLPNGNVIFGDISYKEMTPYVEVIPMDYTLQVRVAGTPTVVLTLPNIEVAEGKNYTIFAIGFVDGEPELEAVLVEDGE